MPQLRQPDVLRLSREGQMSNRTMWTGTPWQYTNMARAESAKPFRPYVWRERERHPVVSPAMAAAFQGAVLPPSPKNGSEEEGR